MVDFQAACALCRLAANDRADLPNLDLTRD